MEKKRETEAELESYVVRETERMGGCAYKFVSPGNAGVPDRLIVFDGSVGFIELKAKGKGPRPIQQSQIRRLQRMGQTVFVVDNREDAVKALTAIKYKARLRGARDEV